MRKLASIQEIKSLEPIPGADRILKAEILGWSIVVSKDEFKVGNKCLFLETDSLCDPVLHPWAAPLKNNNYRVKTIKLRGVLSQGFAVPLKEVMKTITETLTLEIGEDLTKILKIRKYEPYNNSGGSNKFKVGNQDKPFPTHLLPKTDEVRIQSNPSLLEKLKGNKYYITTKLDGTSATFLIDPNTDEFLVCSRNFCRKQSALYGWNRLKTKIKSYFSWGKRKNKLLKKLEEKENVYWYIAKKYNIEKILRKNKHIAIQGEIIGPQIQGNPLNATDYHLFVFNLIDLNHRAYISNIFKFDTICNQFKLKTVPIEETGWNFNCSKDELLEKAQGYYLGTENFKEGIVVRESGDLFDPTSYNEMISFKVLNNDFLLKEK